jgi:hypothetical protein
MARQLTDVTTPAPDKAARRGLTRKIVIALLAVLVLQAVFVLCAISAKQLLVPRNMPFGTVGSSQVVAEAQSKVSLGIVAHPNQSAAMTAIDRSSLYGAYVTGSSSDTLTVVPAKSFFAFTELEAAFLSAAHTLSRPVTVQTVKPLPASDPVGSVAAILLAPLLVGGFLAAVFVFKAAGRIAAAPWRVLILVAFAIVGAVLTDLIAGPLIGAYSNSHFWPLLPCFALFEAAVLLTAATIQAVAGPVAVLVMYFLLIIFGGSSAGGLGVYLLPVYWRNIGVVLPNQNAVTLFTNVIYFGGNNITTPLVVLSLYVLAGAAAIWYLGRIRPARAAAAAHARGDLAEATAAGNPVASPSGPKRGLRPILAALALCAVLECLLAFNNMSSGHAPKATNLPFGATGSSSILTAAQKTISLKVTQYPNESAAKTAMDQFKIWGALIPASTAGTPSTLIVVPSSSDLAPLDLGIRFQDAAKSVGQKITVQEYAPVPLPAKDPFGLVPSLMLTPLLIGGYLASSVLLAATGTAARRWRLVQLAVYAIIAGLVDDLIACFWLQGFASDKFWIVWPICSLTLAAVAFFAAVLQKLLGALGTIVVVVVIIFFGNPSSGGSNGAQYLPTFWRDIGPFLPPRNAYILLHQTIYFSGHGTTQALTVLLIYLVAAGAILAVLDRFLHRERPVPPQSAEAAVAAAAAASAA